jgi:hypothetical protein
MMGETRLNRFMKEVAEITQETDKEKMIFSDTGKETGNGLPESAGVRQGTDGHGVSASDEAVTALLQTGMQLLSSFMSTISETKKSTDGTSGIQPGSFVETDHSTGKKNLKIPLPEETTMRKIAEVAVPFLSRFLDTSKR